MGTQQQLMAALEQIERLSMEADESLAGVRALLGGIAKASATVRAEIERVSLADKIAEGMLAEAML